MIDPNNVEMEAIMEDGCPTVIMEIAGKFIDILEGHEFENRVRALRADEPGSLIL